MTRQCKHCGQLNADSAKACSQCGTELPLHSPQRSRRQIVLSVLLAAWLIAVLLLLILPREPRYDGKSLTQWVDEYRQQMLYQDGIDGRYTDAGYAIRRMGQEAIPQLLKMMESDTGITYRTKKWLNSKQTFYRFKPADGVVERRYAAGSALQLLEEQGRPAFPTLTNWFFNAANNVSLSMSAAQGLAGMSTGVDVLVSSLQSTNKYAKLGAIIALGRPNVPNPRAAADALLSVLTDTNAWSNHRYLAASSLGTLQLVSDDVITALIDGLTDSDPAVRRNSAAALSRFNVSVEKTIPALMAALNDNVADVRYAAAYAIERLQPGTESVQPLILESLRDSDAWQRWNRTVSLTYTHTTNAVIIGELQKMTTNDPDESIRETAGWALNVLTNLTIYTNTSNSSH